MSNIMTLWHRDISIFFSFFVRFGRLACIGLFRLYIEANNHYVPAGNTHAYATFDYQIE